MIDARGFANNITQATTFYFMCQAQALPSKITNLWPDHPIDRIVIANIQNIETGFGEDLV